MLGVTYFSCLCTDLECHIECHSFSKKKTFVFVIISFFSICRTNELHCLQRRARLFRDKQGERHHPPLMDTSQLTCMIECDDALKGTIIGVFAADRLPTQLPRVPF